MKTFNDTLSPLFSVHVIDVAGELIFSTNLDKAPELSCIYKGDTVVILGITYTVVERIWNLDAELLTLILTLSVVKYDPPRP